MRKKALIIISENEAVIKPVRETLETIEFRKRKWVKQKAVNCKHFQYVVTANSIFTLDFGPLLSLKTDIKPLDSRLIESIFSQRPRSLFEIVSYISIGVMFGFVFALILIKYGVIQCP